MTNADIKELLGKIDTQLRPCPLCRDCADNDGRCSSSGLLCDPNKSADELMEQLNDLLSRVEKDQRVIERLTETLKTIRKDKLNASFMNMYIDEALEVVE